MVDDVVPAQRIVLREQADHPFGPDEARVLGLGDLVQQAGVRRVMQIAEQVDADAFGGPAGDLHAGNQRNPVFPGRQRGLGPAIGRVVVGQGHDVESRRRRGGHHSTGRLGAVGNVRMSMQIYPHPTSLVDGQRPPVGPRRAAGETIDA